ADLVHYQGTNAEFLNDNSGVIEDYSYYTATAATETTPGGVTGYEYQTALQRGELGTPVLQTTKQYFLRTAGGTTVAPVASDTVYRNADATGAETTSYAYTWYAGTTLQQSMTVTHPVVTAAENGPGVADTETVVYDPYGRPVWTKDAGGFISYIEYG